MRKLAEMIVEIIIEGWNVHSRKFTSKEDAVRHWTEKIEAELNADQPSDASVKDQPAPVKNHCTIVCGWDENKNLFYMRTFDYQGDRNQKILAQAALKWCQVNCKGGWQISDISTVDIVNSEAVSK